MNEQLDNPIWNALNQTHLPFKIDYGDVKFYEPNYCPFGGFVDIRQTEDALEKYAHLSNNFFVVGEKPSFGEGVKLHNNLICNQMLLQQPINITKTEEMVELRTKEQQTDLFALVNLVQPGYFRAKTAILGTYFGIYKDGILVAVTGERMKMNNYTEVSSVVTHPEYTRRGYAKQLIAHTTDKIFNEDKYPFLHVASYNHGAIRLYEKLGFEIRRKISFWNFVKL